ncbi:MAG: BMP family ABC transporter substrate-binding protein [Ruminococcaceae bacterium]|nr:BMP family ABC transporter substrate-binding protein [Oscillospiraceae bacterium]
MKKHLKLLAVLLALALVFAFTACNKTETPAPGNETVVDPDFKVGVIHISDPAEGAGYTYAHEQGIIAMRDNLGLADEQIIRKINIDDSDAQATKIAIEECIDEGCSIIFGTSFNYMNTMEEMAAEYPDIIFSHGTGYKSNDTNMNNYFGRIYQARYLTGIAAGLKTQSNKIGYVAAMGIDNAEVTGGINAFAMGVASVNPDAKIYVQVTNSWFSPDLEKKAAEALLDMGCDVLGQHCDTTAPQVAAEERGVWGVGYNSDMTKDAPAAHLVAPVWNWGVYYTMATKAAMEGNWTNENYFGDMNDGLIALSPLSENCAEGTADAIEAAKAMILSGEYKVFEGKAIVNGELVDQDLKDNKGNVIVSAGGAVLDDATITGGINWYFENVEA